MPLGPIRALRSRRLFSTVLVFAGLLPVRAACGADELQYPLTAAAAEDGTIYIADRNLPGIWKLAGGKLEVYFQASKRFRTPLNAVRCIALDGDGKVLAGDSATREVYRFDEPGKPTPLTDGFIGIPMGIAATSDGSLLVSDLETHRIWKVPAAGGEPSEFAVIAAPRGIALDGDENLWVVSHSKTPLVRISPEGEIEPVLKERVFEFQHEVRLSNDAATAYVSDGYAKAIWKVDTAAGKAEKWISGEPLDNPVGLAWKGESLLIVDPRAKAVFEADKEGKLTPVLKGEPGASAP